MWHLINRLVDTPSLCLYCIFTCFKAYECWHVDYLVYILHVPYYILILVIMYACIYLLIFVCICFVWLHVVWFPFFFMMHVWLLLFIGYIDMLIISIDSLTYFSIVTLLVVWLSCFPGHVYSHFYIPHSFWHDWLSLLYIILFLSTYCPLCYIPILFIISLPSLCVDMSDISIICMTVWYMTALLLCDACLVCLCGAHIYPFTSNSLVSVDLISLDIVFDMRLVTLFALRSS